MANQSFWTTTSGMATGVAGTLTGLVAIAGIAAQAGWIGGGDNDKGGQSASDTTTTTSSSTTTTTSLDGTDTTLYPDDRTATTEGASRGESGTTGSTTGTTAAAGTPAYSVDPTTVAFQTLGSRSAMVTVRNTGTADLVVEAVDIEGADANRFAATSSACTSAPLRAGRSCQIEVAFTPPSSGEARATLVVDVQDGRSREIPLAGKAVL